MNDANRRSPLNRNFATTHWSVILRSREEPSDAAREALTELTDTYWYPLYVFCRRQGNNEHDAMDLTQGFFAHLLNGNPFESVSPDKGRFRSFLLAAFKNFMANQRRAADTLRRGGAVTTLSLHAEDLSTRYQHEPAHDETPEVCYQRQWTEALLTKVRKRLEHDYRQAGKGELFVLLEPHLTHQDDAASRSEIGQRLKLSTAAVNMSIHRMRRRYGELLRQEVAATVSDPADVEDELRALMSAVSRPSG